MQQENEQEEEENIFKYDEEENCCEPYIVKCIMDYSYCQTQVTECCLDLYNTNTPIRQCVNGVASIRHSIFSQCYFMEPEFENWLSIIWIDEDDDLKEKYIEVDELSFDIISMAQIMMFSKKDNKSTFSILKFKDEYFVNIHNTFYTVFFTGLIKKMDENAIEENIKCTYSFLSITYKKENDEIGIQIDLDRGYYINKNIILTPTFIRRELSYRNRSNDWSKDYTVEIMDHNLVIFTIHPDQYILLENENYKVISIESDYNESEEDNSEII